MHIEPSRSAYASRVSHPRVVESFLKISELWGPSGDEKVVADHVVDQFQRLNIPGATISVDDTAEAAHSNTGNVIIDIPASPDAPSNTPAIGLFFHMDRVPAQAPTLTADNKVPLVVEADGDIHSKDYQTNIAADDRAGYAEIKEAIQTVQENHLAHGRIVVVGFTREEVDGAGAHNIDSKHLEGLQYGFYMDAEATNELMRGGATINSWQARVEGKAAHAGVNPQAGLSAIQGANIAIANMGQLGLVKEGQTLNVSNIVGGVFGEDGSAVTNIIPDKCVVSGEFRGITPTDIQELETKITSSFAKAEKELGVKVNLHMESEQGFYLPDEAPVVGFAQKSMRNAGLQPELTFSLGGSDAGPLNNIKHLPTVLLGNGVQEEHTVHEHINTSALLEGSRVVVSLIQQAVDSAPKV